jgi:hypothetical protein
MFMHSRLRSQRPHLPRVGLRLKRNVRAGWRTWWAWVHPRLAVAPVIGVGRGSAGGCGRMDVMVCRRPGGALGVGNGRVRAVHAG